MTPDEMFPHGPNADPRMFATLLVQWCRLEYRGAAVGSMLAYLDLAETIDAVCADRLDVACRTVPLTAT